MSSNTAPRGEQPTLSIDVVVPSLHTGISRIEIDLNLTTLTTTIVGQSGAGKSTLLTTLAGLTTPARGNIVLNGRALYDAAAGVYIAPHKRKVALVFQSLALFPHLSVLDNVAYGSKEKAKSRRREVAREWLRVMRAAHLIERNPATLSGGEAQRVAIARALASSPELLLLDEPFSALDRELRREIVSEVHAIVVARGVMTILVTHDDDAALFGDTVVELRGGSVKSAVVREAA